MDAEQEIAQEQKIDDVPIQIRDNDQTNLNHNETPDQNISPRISTSPEEYVSYSENIDPITANYGKKEEHQKLIDNQKDRNSSESDEKQQPSVQITNIGKFLYYQFVLLNYR